MTKVLDASCIGGVVTVQGFPIPSAETLSEGLGQSTGILLLDEDTAKYIPKGTPDLKSTLENLIDVLNEVADALTRASDGIDDAASGISAMDGVGYIISVSGGSGAPAVGVPGPPVATGDVSSAQAAASDIRDGVTSIGTIISTLETLKENLI